MRKVLFLAVVMVLAVLFSCEENKVASMKPGDSDTSKQQDVSYPYPVLYSSKFEIGDANQSKMIMELWQDWESGNLNNHKGYWADSIELFLADGTVLQGKKDSVLSSAQGFRNTLEKIVVEVHALAPLRSVDKQENWVTIWGKEVTTDKKGKVDSVSLQETWRFNKDGKVNLMYQFAGKLLPAKKMILQSPGNRGFFIS